MKKPDFCEYCDGALTDVERLVTVYRHRKGRHFIFEGVPARVCPRCGERYIAADVAVEMDQAMRARKPRPTTVTVPIIALRAAG
jgi:YgiT-type zinc finger domain-containing protein